MKAEDQYLKWVEWNDEDSCYVGRCPDLFFGGCHGDDPAAVYSELCEIVKETIEEFTKSEVALPEAKIRPMQEVALS